MMKPVLKIFAVAVALLVVGTAVQAAPLLGVEWRAAANPQTPGVKILSVAPNSNAQELGLEAGDMVLAINNTIVRTGQQATDAVIAANGQLVLLVNTRRNQLVEIRATIDAPTQGFAPGAQSQARYKNITRTRK